MITESISLLDGMLDLLLDRRGGGRPILLLHGGAGPASMRPLFDMLDGFDLVLPTHPGFNATARPEWLSSIAELARCYLALLEALTIRDAVLIGNSVGGWIAAEMAARQPASASRIVLINAVGLQPSESTGPIVDPRSMQPQDLIRLSFADPTRARPPAPEAAEHRRINQGVLSAYAGLPFMHDPTLPERLARISVPSLFLWGRQDGIVTMDYGREYARRIPGSRFELIEDAGHLPQIEQPGETARAILDFCNEGLT